MFNKTSQRPLIVELMDISKQNEAILKFFISGVGNKVFNIGNRSSEVEAYIIDYDFPGAQEHWDENYAADNKPCIILSTDNPQADNSVWVGKPLSSKKLIEAAMAIKDILKKSPSITSPTLGSDSEDLGREITPKRSNTKASSLASETVLPKKNTIPKKVSMAPLVSSEQSADAEATVGNNKGTLGKATKSESGLSHIAVGKLKSEHAPKKDAINKPKTKEQIGQEVAQREMRWKELCGDNNDTSTHQADEVRYVPENYFIGKLTGAVRLAKQSQQIVEVKARPHSVYILPDKHQIFTALEIGNERFIQFSRDKVQQGEMNIHILSSIETGKLELQMSQQPEYIHSLESFLWTSSLLASKGRIPATMDIDKKTALKYWPSFARIEAFPYSMRIAALWHHSPDTLIQMATKLAIPQRYVFAFYNGADALGLIEHDPKKVKKQIKASPKAKGGGLISRLFKRLLGGEPS